MLTAAHAYSIHRQKPTAYTRKSLQHTQAKATPYTHCCIGSKIPHQPSSSSACDKAALKQMTEGMYGHAQACYFHLHIQTILQLLTLQFHSAQHMHMACRRICATHPPSLRWVPAFNTGRSKHLQLLLQLLCSV